MNRTAAACILSAAAGLVHGASLVPHALICDAASDLQVIDQILTPKDQHGHTGAELLGLVRDSAQFWAGMRHIGELQASEAAQEERIGGTYGYPVNTAARSQQAQALIEDADRKRVARLSILAHCMATDHKQSATVLKRRAIAGYLWIRTAVHGQQAEVWTKARFVVSP